MEQVELSIADADNTIQEYVETGGNAPVDYERKSDLHQVLPNSLKEHMTSQATNDDQLAQKHASVSNAIGLDTDRANVNTRPNWTEPLSRKDPMPTMLS